MTVADVAAPVANIVGKAPVPVHQEGWTWSTWILSAILALLTGAFAPGFVAWVKARATIEKQRDDSDAGIRSELRDSLRVADAKISALEDRVRKAETHSSTVDLRVAQFEFVLRLVIDELERKDPGNPVAQQARSLMAVAYPVKPVPPEMQALVLEAGKPSNAEPSA